MHRSLLLLAGLVTMALPVAKARPYTSQSDSPKEKSLTWGVYAFLGQEETRAIYEPLARRLQQSLPGYQVQLEILPLPELTQAALEKRLDILSTNPTHFIELRHKIPGTAPIATLVNSDPDGSPQTLLGGCIFARAEDTSRLTLNDLKTARIAFPSTSHLGGYLAQIFELHFAGIRLPPEARLLPTGSHKTSLKALVEGRADIAFVRTGIAESMIAHGEISPSAIRLLNPQNHPGFHWLCSTRLYPEWPVLALPHTQTEKIRHAAAALLLMESSEPALKAAKIHGFTIPADYQSVDELARALRLPPYDKIPDFTLADIWAKYHHFILVVLLSAAAIAALTTAWLLSLRRQIAIQARLRDQLEQANQSLKNAAAQASQTAQFKADFLATMSHEIRTPLNGLLGILHLLSGDPSLPPHAANHIQIALKSGESLLRLLSDILDLSKIESGRMTIQTAPFDLHLLLREQLNAHAPARQNSTVQPLLEIDPATPRWVTGDAARIGQILGNLLSNAFKFTSTGHVVLRARPLTSSPDTPILRFEVEDTGPGIPPSFRPSLFERFEQADPSAARRLRGTGLGLAICKHLTTLMGGHIGVESTPGKGSLFWLELPLPPAPAPSPEQSQQSPPPSLPQTQNSSTPSSHASPKTTSDAPSPATPQSKPSVLVVEDNPTNQLVASGLLKKLGCEPFIASSGAEAIEKISRQPFDLILMDVQMPDMDGFQTTQTLRSQFAPSTLPPIIAMTAHAMPGDRQRCLDSGMDDYLTKPVKPQELGAKLRQWLPTKFPQSP